MKNTRCSLVTTGVGAWKFVSMVNSTITFEILRDRVSYIVKRKPDLRDNIKQRLMQMNALYVSKLKETQYQSFYNFLNVLESTYFRSS